MNKIQEELSKLNRPEYISDTRRIVQVAFAHGILLSLKEAEAIWEDYSDSMAAGWMGLPKDDGALWRTISRSFEDL